MLVTLLTDEATEEDELSFAEGDAIVVLSTDDPDWWFGVRQRDGARGYFPAAFAEPATA